MKTCNICHLAKELTEFNVRNRAKNTYHGYCKDCAKTYQQQWYAANKSEHKQDVYRLRRIRLEEIRTYIRQLKESTPCTDCGRNYPWYVMDFDHIRDKTDTVSQIARHQTLTRVIEEIAKCEIRCANCHRIKTFNAR